MFGKKKPSLPPYILQVLTTEYLVDGTVEGDTRLYFSDLGGGFTLRLTSARIQATGPVDMPPRTCAQYMVGAGHVVAYIPGMEVSLVPGYNELWKDYKNPIQGVFYCGRYLMQGRFMTYSPELVHDEIPAFDVRITTPYQTPHWNGLYVPFALINVRWLQGYELA